MMDKQDELYNFAKLLVDEGFGIWAVGTNKKALRNEDDQINLTRDEANDRALEQIDQGKAQGVALRLGWESCIESADGMFLVPFMLERESPSKASAEFRQGMKDAIYAAGATTTFSALNKHWVEDSPSGGRHWYGLVEVKDERAWYDLKRKLPATESFAQTPQGVLLAAELIVVGYSVVAPSYGATHKSGEPWSFVVRPDGEVRNDVRNMPIIKPGSLRSMSKALAEASASDASLGEALLPVPGIGRPVMRAYNAEASDHTTLDMLLEAGWTINAGDLDTVGFVELTRPDPDGTATPRSATIGREHRRYGDEDLLPGGVMVWTAGDPVLPKGYHTPFDVYARLAHKGKVARAVNALYRDELIDTTALTDKERAALNDGDRVFFDPEHIDLNSPEHTSTGDLSAYVAMRLREIESPRGDVPYVLRLAPGIGMRADSLLEVNSTARQVKKWEIGDLPKFAQVIKSAVQPVEFRETDEGVRYTSKLIHEVSPTLRDAIFYDLVSDAHIPVVALQLEEPTFLRVGETDEFRVVQRAGLDLETQSHLDLDGEKWAEYRVEEMPSLEDAEQAYRYLTSEVLGDFYFETPEDYARAVVYLLSTVARPATRIAPSFGFDAPGKGAGKSLLARAGHILARGKGGGVTNITDPSSKANEEVDKRIGAAMIAGHRFLHVDELGRAKVDAPVLMTLTATPDGGNSSRELGKSSMLDVSGMVLTVCGNNIRVGGDINRRFLNIRLQQTEITRAMHAARPPKHKYLDTATDRNRPRLLAAAHTLLLHGVQNAPATTYERLMSFETWADVVLAALTHVRIAGDDLSIAQRAFEGRSDWMDEQEDTSRTIWVPVLELLARTFGDDAFDAGQAQDALKNAKMTAGLPHTLKDIVHSDERHFARMLPASLQPILQTQIPSEDGTSLLAVEKRKDRNKRNVYRVTSIARGEVKPTATIFVEAPTNGFANPAPVAARSTQHDDAEEVAL